MIDQLFPDLLSKMWHIEIYLWKESLTSELLNIFHTCWDQVLLKPLDEKMSILSSSKQKEHTHNKGAFRYNDTSANNFSLVQEPKRADLDGHHQQICIVDQLQQLRVEFEGQLCEASDVGAFQDAGWDVRHKGAPEHRTLENLLKRNLSDDVNGVLGDGKKTLLLVVGELTPSLLDRVEMYFKTDNWSVEFYGFRSVSEVSDRLRAEYPSRFRSAYLSRTIKNLLKGRPDSSGNERFVFMNLDSIMETLFRSNTLYKMIPGAASARDIRVNFSAVTKIVCGEDQAKVKRQVATYATTNPLLAQKLVDLKWEVDKQAPTASMSALVEILEQLVSSTVPTPQEPKTLVLVMGDRGLTVSDRMVWSRLLAEFVAKQWHIEIFSWVRTLSDEFLGAFLNHRDQVLVYALDNTLHVFTYLKPGSLTNTTAGPTFKLAADGTETIDLPPLQQQMHPVQVAFVAMQADAATVRTKYQKDINTQLQQLKSAFELQLREQRNGFDAEYRRLQDDFETRLRKQEDAFTASRQRYEKDTERRFCTMENTIARLRLELKNEAEHQYDQCQSDIAAVNSSMEEMSRRLARNMAIHERKNDHIWDRVQDSLRIRREKCAEQHNNLEFRVEQQDRKQQIAAEEAGIRHAQDHQELKSDH
ncbi:hypothetical protein AM587_10009067 [Phytophthora nicotianae]|uniref:Uncharacterized protein n=1 Tax=Phytophthora nicotianae TaxID=4792 RepID=A0A0W8CEM7_PHYNI|nr:hypothetical protein AM587_10009067 [Phytophthora nicotianae]